MTRVSARAGSSHQLVHLKLASGSTQEVEVSEESTSEGTSEERLSELDGKVVVLLVNDLDVLEQGERLGVSSVGDTDDGTVGDGLEVTAASLGRVVHVTLLVMVTSAERLVLVVRVRRLCVHHVVKMHFLLN